MSKMMTVEEASKYLPPGTVFEFPKGGATARIKAVGTWGSLFDAGLIRMPPPNGKETWWDFTRVVFEWSEHPDGTITREGFSCLIWEWKIISRPDDWKTIFGTAALVMAAAKAVETIKKQTTKKEEEQKDETL